MATPPAIYTFQASDADRYSGKIRAILQQLKAENRIHSFTNPGASPSLDQIKDGDIVLLLLTNGFETRKKQLENRLKSMEVRVIEIIIDKVVYDNEFLTFPADLKPMRDREDEDVYWASIEKNLKNMLPAQEPEPEPADDSLPWWLQGVLEWPWKSPGRWHGALFLGLPAVVLITVFLYLTFPGDFERDPGFIIVAILFSGLMYTIAGAISRMRKASLFFALAMAIGIMILFVFSWGVGIDDYIGAALALIGPISAVVGAAVGLSQKPFRLAGMLILGLWPLLFAEQRPYDSAFLLNSILIAVVLCLLAWRKPIHPKKALKFGLLPYALNLIFGLLIYVAVGFESRYLEFGALFFTVVTLLFAASLFGVYRINRRRFQTGN